MSYTLTVLDTAGIQPFIFSSNELRENAGASELVYRATRLWAFEALHKLLGSEAHNVSMSRVHQDETWVFKPVFRIEERAGEKAAEVLYAGGGNTVILFGGPENNRLARDFVYRLSRKMLVDAPGLNLYASHQEYEWGGRSSLPDVLEAGLEELSWLKREFPGALPTLGLSVTAACTSTGLPANVLHRDPDKKGTLASLANWQVEQKWQAAHDAKTRLRGKFPSVEAAGFQWSDDLDNLPPRDRGESYVAIVHADANGMGQRIAALNTNYKESQPRAYIEAMRRFSGQIQETALAALQATIDILAAHLQTEEGADKFYTDTDESSPKKGTRYFPLRPIVFGGDDATWVCAGQWGLSLARRYLAELEKRELDDGRPPYGRAGIAIVKTHYPFSQAYRLSEDLAASAKGLIRQVATDKMASALDWHFTTTGLTGDLEQIRRREYKDGSLLARPLLLRSDLGSWRNWTNFDWTVNRFQDERDWGQKRNKLMALREALREGPTAVRQFSRLYRQKLPLPPGIRVGQYLSLDDGWVAVEEGIVITSLSLQEQERLKEDTNRCFYYDAVEIADHFFDLPETQEGAL